MKENKIYDQNWKDIYESGKMLNKYPFDILVSFAFRQFAGIKDKSKIKVLDIGCGAGNNSWFLAKEGFDITAIDFSEEAINFAKNRFKNENLTGKFYQKNFLEIADLQEKYDFIIDREALYTQDYKDLKIILKSRENKLTEKGVFISFFYNIQNPIKQFYNKTENNITFYPDNENNTVFGKRASFLDEKSVKELFYLFDYELYNHLIIPVKIKNDILTGMGEYIIICKKNTY